MTAAALKGACEALGTDIVQGGAVIVGIRQMQCAVGRQDKGESVHGAQFYNKAAAR